MAGGIAAGAAHSCAIVATGAVCWGANDQHQLGSAAAADSPYPQRVGATSLLHVVALGRAHGCGLTADQLVVCWGANDLGQVATGGAASVGTAIPVPNLGERFAFLAAGAAGDRSCAATADANVACWGGHHDPRLGTVVTRPASVIVLPPGALSGLAVGDEHACAVIAGRILCWGEGSSGQLGNGYRDYAQNAVPVGGSDPG